jgi:cold shock CspA family protein
MRIDGKLVKWNDERGFGFILADSGGPEVFVHVSGFRGWGGRPRLGERVSFEIALDEDQRKRAVDVRPIRPRSVRRDAAASSRTGPLRAVAGIVLLIAAAAGIYHYASERFPGAHAVEVTAPSGAPVVVTESDDGRFRCDGRQHCSQMTSCAEARFFLRHCPGTQMDGDGDGEPCENQWCGH